MESGEGARRGRMELARSVAEAVELGIRLHREDSPVHRWEEGAASRGAAPGEPERLLAGDSGTARALVPPRVLAEIIAWMGAQWADTWSFDYEAAAIRFDIPVEVLRSEVTSYLRRRAGYRNRRN